MSRLSPPPTACILCLCSTTRSQEPQSPAGVSIFSAYSICPKPTGNHSWAASVICLTTPSTECADAHGRWQSLHAARFSGNSRPTATKRNEKRVDLRKIGVNPATQHRLKFDVIDYSRLTHSYLGRANAIQSRVASRPLPSRDFRYCLNCLLSLRTVPGFREAFYLSPPRAIIFGARLRLLMCTDRACSREIAE
jgi:hypothetical protein